MKSGEVREDKAVFLESSAYFIERPVCLWWTSKKKRVSPDDLQGFEEMFCLIGSDGSQYTDEIPPLNDMPSSNTVSNFRINLIITEAAMSNIHTDDVDIHSIHTDSSGIDIVAGHRE